jgi:hypothetical protein
LYTGGSDLTVEGTMRAGRTCAGLLALGVLLSCSDDGVPPSTSAPRGAAGGSLKPAEEGGLRMSAMGRRAAIERRAHDEIGKLLKLDDSGQDDGDLPGGSQGEISVAVDDSGQHVVVGFNDTRGFRTTPFRVSGFMYSDDGGKTFVDGGQLPSDDPDGDGLPQVFGDPDVKYMGACTFIYTSILVVPFGETSAAQTMGFHRSFDCGHTWEGPFEITSATNPTGEVDAAGNPLDAADKEFIDVDRATGRVIMSWTNFGVNAVEISTTYSDNVLDQNPTWSPAAIVGAREEDGQGSIPRFGRGDDVYVAWRTFPDFNVNAIGFARSTDGGATWEPARNISADFFAMDQVLGNDRINSSPSMAVDGTRGRHRNTIYVTYSQNDSRDGGDIVVQRSTDRGVTFSAPVVINSRPGADRSQWFPWVTVDDFGRVFVYYYDQGIADSGDGTQVSYTWSDDGGVRWAQPRPLTRPFKAGWGNDTGQPNLGDYNQSVTHRGDFMAAFASTRQVGFADNQPFTNMTTPEPTFRRTSRLEQLPVTSVDLRGAAVREIGGDRDGFVDPGESALARLSIRNYVTNPVSGARTLRGVFAIVDTATPGASVAFGLTAWRDLSPGETDDALVPVVLRLGAGFEPGRDVELRVRVFSLSGLPMTLHATVRTGTPTATSVLATDFEAGAPGWQVAHGAGANTVPWTLVTGFCGDSVTAFHQNADDGPAPNQHARWERLISPTVVIPADADTVTLEMDVCYDTELDPAFNILAYDGFFLRVTDVTPGRTLRSVLLEAFAEEFTTGDIEHYPKHFPRSGNPAYFEDMSAWAGDSGGVRRVRARLPGMAGSSVQLRFEFTQDGNTICDTPPCGVAIDNIVLSSVTYGP